MQFITQNLSFYNNNEEIRFFKTIGEVSAELNLSPHVLRFWETKFSNIKPHKRKGGHRYYSLADIEKIKEIKALLYSEGFTIKGAQKFLKQKNKNKTLQQSNNNVSLHYKENKPKAEDRNNKVSGAIQVKASQASLFESINNDNVNNDNTNNIAELATNNNKTTNINLDKINYFLNELESLKRTLLEI